jgi:molybdopterin/thiamine biosynthesis adenylyltransferase
VSLDLLGLGVQDLRIVDFDKVELSNLNRQILYAEADLGQPKVDRALHRLTGYSARASVTGVEKRLTSAADVADAVRDRDIVICAADRPKMEVIEWVNAGCVAAGVPFIAGGVETQRSVLYLVVPGETGCVECWRRTSADDTESRAVRIQMADLHTEGGIGPDRAAFGGLVTVLTGMMISELVRFVTGIAEPIALGQLIEIHFDDLVPHVAEQWKRLPDCPVCGDVEARYRYRRTDATA